MHKTNHAVCFSPNETTQLVQLVLPFLPTQPCRILDVRCYDGTTTRELAACRPDCDIHGIDTHNGLFDVTRPRVETLQNASVYCRDLRQLRNTLTDENDEPMTDGLYDVVIFFRSAGSYRTKRRYAITSLGRAVLGACDLLKPSGRMILIRSHACQEKMSSMLDDQHYEGLFSPQIGFTIVKMNKDIIVVDYE